MLAGCAAEMLDADHRHGHCYRYGKDPPGSVDEAEHDRDGYAQSHRQAADHRNGRYVIVVG
jgi:hypothetical protein